MREMVIDVFVGRGGARPRLLDLFCGAGGAGMGYHRSGFEVVGVDIKPQPHYPFEFYQKDAFEALAVLGPHCDAVHASPPCQAYCSLRFLHGGNDGHHEDLVDRVRVELQKTGRPWVIENVTGSPLRNAAMLCGSAFGLGAVCRDGEYHQLRRHRFFEGSHLVLGTSCMHKGRPIGVYGHGGSNNSRPSSKGFQCLAREGRLAMGIAWMARDELVQAVPPAYTEYIGRQLLSVLSAGRRRDGGFGVRGTGGARTETDGDGPMTRPATKTGNTKNKTGKTGKGDT